MPSTMFSVFCRALLIVALAISPAQGASTSDWRATMWTGTWGAAPAGPPLPANAPVFTNQTLRLVVHTSIAGKQVRIRVSNEMGSAPLHIGAAHIGVRASGAGVVPGTDRVLTFSGNAGIVIPPGAPALSDPVDLDVPALADLAISVYLPGTASATTMHRMGLQTQYVSAPGDHTGAAAFPVQSTLSLIPFLAEVDVASAGSAVVALGDSITDGMRSTVDTNNRWPDWLARRLQGAIEPVGVVNRGISANRLLVDPAAGSLAGRAILERFDRDVLATAGVRSLVLMIGINDIGAGDAANPVSAGDLIAGYRQVIARAHAHGIAVYGATLTPIQGSDYDSAGHEAVRQAVNDWIRSGGAFDAVIDFDRVTRDPGNAARLLPAYDSGDHLHPSDAGYRAMGNAVPLAWFRTPAAVKAGQAALGKAHVRVPH